MYSPFTRTAALEAGMTPAQLRSSRFVALLRNVYVSSEVTITPLLLARAALTVSPPGAFICRGTAGQLLGSGQDATGEIHVGIVAGPRPRTSGLHAHRYATRPPLVTLAGVRLTSTERTFIDLASTQPLVPLVMAADQFVALGRTTPDRLIEAAAQWHGRGAGRAREAAPLVRDGVESRMESAARLLMVFAGLPEPTVNLRLRDGSGRSRRIDLAYPDLKIAVEYDGRHHIERESQWRRDLLRREDVEALGWRFVVLTSVDIFTTPAKTVDRITAALRARGARVLPHPGWRLHFAGRAALA